MKLSCRYKGEHGASRRSTLGRGLALSQVSLARPHRILTDNCDCNSTGIRCSSDGRSFSGRAAARNVLVARSSFSFCIAHDNTLSGGTRRLFDLHVHLHDAAGQEPQSRNAPDPTPWMSSSRCRCSAISPSPCSSSSLFFPEIGWNLNWPRSLRALQARHGTWRSAYTRGCTVPTDLDEASRSFRFSGWQRF